jgi:hypothetical protein
MRLTPHYAAHTFDLANRVSTSLVDETRSCGDGQSALSEDGRCVWTASTGFFYDRDGGEGATDRHDSGWMVSVGGQAPLADTWTLGGALGGSEAYSVVDWTKETLSDTTGDMGQGNVYLKYDNGSIFGDVVAFGGGGRFNGKRNTCVTPVLSAQSDSYSPTEVFYPDECDETSGTTTYLDDLVALPGIGKEATYTQDIVWAGGSARLGATATFGSFYVRPQVEGTARWLQIGAYQEKGTEAAMAFDRSDTVFLSGTPALELGIAHLGPSGIATRAFVRGGVEFTDTTWAIDGGFVAAESLNVPNATFSEDADTPVGRIDAGISVMGAHGSGLKAGYSAGVAKDALQHEFFAKLNLGF